MSNGNKKRLNRGEPLNYKRRVNSNNNMVPFAYYSKEDKRYYVDSCVISEYNIHGRMKSFYYAFREKKEKMLKTLGYFNVAECTQYAKKNKNKPLTNILLK